MDLSVLLKALGPIAEPIIEQSLNQYWPQVDAAISTITQADERALLQALSPVMKVFLIAELQKYLAK